MLVKKKADFLPRRIDQYVPRMQYASSAGEGGIGQINFGAPAIASTTFIVANVALSSGASKEFVIAKDDLTAIGSSAPFGRNVTITSGGANTRDVTVKGRDYLGQPMSETIVFSGAATVAGKKAFTYLDDISVDSEANTPTVSIGFGALLGVPYRVTKVISSEADGAVATLGTLVAGSRVTQTMVTADPRGTIDPATTLDETAVITATVVFDNYIDSDGVGGLHGVPHFYA